MVDVLPDILFDTIHFNMKFCAIYFVAGVESSSNLLPKCASMPWNMDIKMESIRERIYIERRQGNTCSVTKTNTKQVNAIIGTVS